uniref:RxLR effector protein n=1 Tax=Globisporangium ultimum (strain ATCC 200006 / CBS 805.95 / DAOM BR144) TaxID=431595 RepID=K3XDL7_GLOUD
MNIRGVISLLAAVVAVTTVSVVRADDPSSTENFDLDVANNSTETENYSALTDEILPESGPEDDDVPQVDSDAVETTPEERSNDDEDAAPEYLDYDEVDHTDDVTGADETAEVGADADDEAADTTEDDVQEYREAPSDEEVGADADTEATSDEEVGADADDEATEATSEDVQEYAENPTDADEEATRRLADDDETPEATEDDVQEYAENPNDEEVGADADAEATEATEDDVQEYREAPSDEEVGADADTEATSDEE